MVNGFDETIFNAPCGHDGRHLGIQDGRRSRFIYIYILETMHDKKTNPEATPRFSGPTDMMELPSKVSYCEKAAILEFKMAAGLVVFSFIS